MSIKTNKKNENLINNDDNESEEFEIETGNNGNGFFDDLDTITKKNVIQTARIKVNDMLAQPTLERKQLSLIDKVKKLKDRKMREEKRRNENNDDNESDDHNNSVDTQSEQDNTENPEETHQVNNSSKKNSKPEVKTQLTNEVQNKASGRSKSQGAKQAIAQKSNNTEARITFSDLNLIKPLLKACSDCGYANPTKVQEMAIPPILNGRDVLVSSITGSGKTATFLLPIIQNYYNRLLANKTSFNSSRVLIIIPTRELAIQCYEMFQTLNKYSKLSCTLLIGATSMEKQRSELNRYPLIIIATPGRLIDHVQNSQNFDLEDIEVLILDEADKLLELGFMYELKTIIKSLNRQHQTLLFSATLSGKVDELVDLALNKPIRIQANPDFKTADRLKQEYIRLKDGSEKNREAGLLALAEIFKEKVMIFFKTKKQCHRMAIIFNLLDLKSTELHGNLSQNQRVSALDDFKDGKVNFLLATDLAARGIDIRQVKSVINFELPMELTRYIHRVGRTARAGFSGVSITMCDENEAKKLKKMLKESNEELHKRDIDANKFEEYRRTIFNLQDEINKVYKMESYEKELRKAEMEATKAENMIKYKDEIYNRPKKKWIVSNRERNELKQRQKEQIEINNMSRYQDDNDDNGDFSSQPRKKLHTKDNKGRKLKKESKRNFGEKRSQERKKFRNK